jgi:ubiquinone/menaquinone biosynthesis C-methylase UbiE
VQAHEHGHDHDQGHGGGHDHGAEAEVDWDAQGERYAQARHHVTDTAAYEALVRDATADAPAGSVFDVGAGTGIWSPLLARWTGRPVVALEPAAGMQRHAVAKQVAGVHHVTAAVPRLPLVPASGAAAWLSAVLHHVDDMAACARELRRVLAPGAPVLVRGAFAGRCDGMPQVRYFPETQRRFDTRFPTVEATEAAFAAAGFRRRSLTAVQEHTIDVRAWRRLLPDQRRTDTSLVHLTDDEFAAGLARIDADIAAGDVERHAVLDLLVLA